MCQQPRWLVCSQTTWAWLTGAQKGDKNMVINLSHAFEQLLPEMVEEINRNKYGEIVRVDYPDVDIEKEEDIARELIGRVLKMS